MECYVIPMVLDIALEVKDIIAGIVLKREIHGERERERMTAVANGENALIAELRADD